MGERAQKNFHVLHAHLDSPRNSKHMGGKRKFTPYHVQKKSGTFGNKFGPNLVQTSSMFWTSREGGGGGCRV